MFAETSTRCGFPSLAISTVIGRCGSIHSGFGSAIQTCHKEAPGRAPRASGLPKYPPAPPRRDAPQRPRTARINVRFAPKRPKCCVAAKRRYVPAADICSAAKTSLDHLVSNLLKMHRDIKSKGLSHPEIDKKLETGRLLHRKFTRLSAFQNLVDVDSHTPERVETVRPVCHKRTSVKCQLAISAQRKVPRE